MHSRIARKLAPIAVVALFGVAAAACNNGTGASNGGKSNTPTTAVNSGSTPTTASPGGSGGAGF
ncbi:MAG: hypothetical protein KGJ77_10470 [Acidobacteriota bacterium]|nr:hypothetical protein [Acidobacteriota bacterium]